MCIFHFSSSSVFLSIFLVLQYVFLILHIFQFSLHIQVLQCVFLIFHDFQFSCHIPRPTVDISKFSTFFSFPRHISRPKVCISHFPWFSVFSPYSRSFSVHFSFFTFFSDFVIFQVFKWMFLILHDFQFSCHISRPTEDISKYSTFFSFPRHISRPKVCISHFPWFSVFSPYSRSFSVHFSFFTFFSDFVIFQVVKWMFLIFQYFQVSCHIPGLTLSFSHFPSFSLFLDIFHPGHTVFLFTFPPF